MDDPFRSLLCPLIAVRSAATGCDRETKPPGRSRGASHLYGQGRWEGRLHTLRPLPVVYHVSPDVPGTHL